MPGTTTTPITDRLIAFGTALATAALPLLIDLHVLNVRTSVDVGFIIAAIAGGWHGKTAVTSVQTSNTVAGSDTSTQPVLLAAAQPAPVAGTMSGTVPDLPVPSALTPPQ